jgi:hypothetical protein
MENLENFPLPFNKSHRLLFAHGGFRMQPYLAISRRDRKRLLYLEKFKSDERLAETKHAPQWVMTPKKEGTSVV